MKKILILLALISFSKLNAQVLFSDNFSSLTLQNDVQVIGSKTITTTYTTVPNGYYLIDDGFKNNVGSNNAPNKPFNVLGLKTTGWAVVYNAIENDTFLVTTSWLDTTAAANRFIVTPVINGIAANSVLSWEAKSPDANYREGYEVYVTTNTTGTLTASSFSLTDRVFNITDGNTTGGGEKSVWTKRGVSLAKYAGQNIRVAFKNISQNMYQLWVDDITVANLNDSLDAELSAGLGIYKYNTINTNDNINFRFTNKGYKSTNLLSLQYSIKGPANYGVSETFILSTPVNPYGFTDLTFSTPYNMSAPGYYNVKIWVNGVNGANDQNKLNDTIYTGLSIMTAKPSKSVLVEQFLSTFDGNSPDGQEKLAALTSSNVIAVNIHDGDSLRNTSASGIISAYKKKSTTAIIDRNYFNDISSSTIERGSYSTRINQRLAAVVPASISITAKNYNTTTRELTFTVQTNFVAETFGDYRLNAYITENNVGVAGADTTFNGWNQLSFMYNTPWSPYYQKGYYLASANGYVLNAWQYKHKNVLDTVLDGSFGAAGIIPMTGGTLNQTYTKAYSYTLPIAPAGINKYNPDNIYIVANISEFNMDVAQRNILNCAQDKVTANAEMVSVMEQLSAARFNIYPNPANGLVNLLIPENSFNEAITITITDILGKVVYTEMAGMKFGLIQLNLYHLENGAYFIKLKGGNSERSQKLIISK